MSADSSQMSSHGELRALGASPAKGRALRAPKMPKLNLNGDDDDIEKVNVRDFIKKSKRQ